MSFDDIAGKETLELRSVPVKIKGTSGKEYKFTVNELSPTELAKCVDEFGTFDILPIVYRSVRDEDGKRMSVEQAKKLNESTLTIFINAYSTFQKFTSEKKTKTKKKS